jgi:hypothetical protein
MGTRNLTPLIETTTRMTQLPLKNDVPLPPLRFPPNWLQGYAVRLVAANPEDV